MTTRLRSAIVCGSLAVALLTASAGQLAADAKRYRACVFPDRTRPTESVIIDDLRANESIYDTGGLDFFWVFGPLGGFQISFKDIKQIEVMQWLGKDPSRPDFIRYSVKVTGNPSGSGQAVYGTLDIRTLRGVAGPTGWYYAPAVAQDRGSKFWRIVFDTPCAGPTVPLEPAGPAKAAPGLLLAMALPSEPLPEPPAAAEQAGAMPNVDELGDVFFEYDKWDLSEVSRATLVRNVEWMRRWPNTRLLVEGQADVRGTNEYNFPLGQRRASAARDYMLSLGIAPERLVTATMGKTNLVCTSLDEICWQRNRRAHFSLLAR